MSEREKQKQKAAKKKADKLKPDYEAETKAPLETADETVSVAESSCACENLYRPKPHKILDITKLTDILYTFRVETDVKPDFGQFYQISLPRVGEAPFSISAVGDGWVDFTIRSVGNLTGVLQKKRVGDVLFMRGPYGNGFAMEEFKGQHLVVVAGGSGVSPVKPLIDYYYDHESEIDKLDILFGFRTPNDILFIEDIERWKKKFNLIITVDYACGEWDNEYVGLVQNYVKDIRFSKFPKMEIIIVGHPMMAKYTANEFINRGVPQNRILLSYERKMSCGLGKCGHCKINDTYVCVDGPVFRYDKAIILND